MTTLIVITLWVLAGQHAGRMFLRDIGGDIDAGELGFALLLALAGPFSLAVALFAAPETLFRDDSWMDRQIKKVDPAKIAERIFRP